MIPNTEVVETPKRMAPRPVPVMWLQLPVIEGIFSDEMTKINAPAIANSKIDLRCCCTSRRMAMTPAARNGMQTAPHAMQNAGGKYPSMMCMADAVWGTQSTRLAATEKDMIFFSIVVMLIPPFCKK